eukprot:Hpha_TRINITY_DN15222_c5_g4::TRINITY_DN15222_c5_g4_i1::g.66843::m.66843
MGPPDVRLSRVTEIAFSTYAISDACLALQRRPSPAPRKPDQKPSQRKKPKRESDGSLTVEVFAKPTDSAERWRMAQRLGALDRVWQGRVEDEVLGMARLWIKEDIDKAPMLLRVKQPRARRFIPSTMIYLTSVSRFLSTNLNHLFNRLVPAAWLSNKLTTGSDTRVLLLWPVRPEDRHMYRTAQGSLALGKAVPALVRMLSESSNVVFSPLFREEFLSWAGREATCYLCFKRIVAGHPRWAPSAHWQRALLSLAAKPPPTPTPSERAIEGNLERAADRAGGADAAPPKAGPECAGEKRRAPPGGWRVLIVER